jgi:hypothetical protein
LECKPKIKLSTQNDPVNLITNLLENLGIPTHVKKRAKLENRLDYIKCDINLDLLDVTNKKTDSVDFLKQVASETLTVEGVGEGVY